MDAAIAAALAREAVKKKDAGLEKAETNAHKPKEKIVVEPKILTTLKKGETKERESFEVNAVEPPAVNVQLKKMSVQERPKIEVNATPLPKVELKKTSGPKPKTNEDIQPTKIQETVQLKKTAGPRLSSTTSNNESGENKSAEFSAVKLKKTEVKERPSITSNSTALPGVSLKHAEAGSTSHKDDSDTPKGQADFGVHLRKPGKGRMKHLEKFY